MGDPPEPVPDAKDWTWTITSPCPECGFDPTTIGTDDVGDRTRQYVGVLRTALRGEHAAARPHPEVWSPLEYGCHVRDVCELFDRRLTLMLTQDDPLFDNWDQDETAIAKRYWDEDPRAVESQLEHAANAIAASFAAVRGDQWERPGRRSNGSVFTVETFARYFLHDVAHHAWDVAIRTPSAG